LRGKERTHNYSGFSLWKRKKRRLASNGDPFMLLGVKSARGGVVRQRKAEGVLKSVHTQTGSSEAYPKKKEGKGENPVCVAAVERGSYGSGACGKKTACAIATMPCRHHSAIASRGRGTKKIWTLQG